MTTTIETSSPVTSSYSVCQGDLQLAAAIYILWGKEALPQDVLAAVQIEIARRLEKAESLGLTRREVVLAFLRPLFCAEGHCRCPSCQQRCVVCKYSHLLATSPSTPSHLGASL